MVDAERPDVVVMDIQMPGELDGIEATRRITARHPDVRVVMLTMNEDDDTVLSAIRAGASGYLLKGSGADEVLAAVRAAHAGRHGLRRRSRPGVADLFAAPAAAGRRRPCRPHASASASVLDLLAAGRSNDAIARELFVSNKTVRNTVSAIYAKLHAPAGPRRSSRRGRRASAAASRRRSTRPEIPKMRDARAVQAR